jgi:hypothetical protein
MLDSSSYYRLTEEAYLALCPELGGHMNMGLWPAQNLYTAQSSLVQKFCEFLLRARMGMPTHIVDAGSGWGASRPIFELNFPKVPYIGINSSAKQVTHARLRAHNTPGTEYVLDRVENITKAKVEMNGTLVSVEAAFHFEDKGKLLLDLVNLGFEDFAIADICVRGQEIVKSNKLLAALWSAWTEDQYRSEALNAGFHNLKTENVSGEVFEGMAAYVESLNVNEFIGPGRLLRQFKTSFRIMADLFLKGNLSYVFIYGSRR